MCIPTPSPDERSALARVASYGGFKSAEARSAKAEAISGASLAAHPGISLCSCGL